MRNLGMMIQEVMIQTILMMIKLNQLNKKNKEKDKKMPVKIKL
jgi:hypothetical protein